MRLVLIVLITVTMSALPVQSQGWVWLNPLPQGNGLNEIEYMGDGQLFSTGYSGVSIGSTDNGQTWEIRQPGDEPCPRVIDFVNPLEGWGITDVYTPFERNSIYHTADGGASWQSQFHRPNIALEDISVPSAQSAWVVGYVDSTSRLVILHSIDGGSNWTETVHDSDGYVSRVFFLNELEGWIMLENSLLHTTNGGASWEPHATGLWFYFDFVFTSSQNGWGSGFTDVYRTTDGGQSWVPLNAPAIDTEWIRSVAVVNGDDIWAVTSTDGVHIMADHVLYSPDGGTTWTRRTMTSTSNLNKVVFADAQRGWICGEDGTVYQTVNGGTNWTQRCGDPETVDWSYTCVDFADLQNGWMGAHSWDVNGPIWHTMDGGVSWSEQYQAENSYFFDIEALSATNVWAVGSAILHTTDGGEHWNEIDLGDHAYMQIECIGDHVIWIASGWDYPNRVHRSTDGGATWETHDVEIGLKFNGMAAGDANNVWVAGWADLDDGSLAHSSDGGVTWELLGDTLGYFDGIFFLDALNGWAGVWSGLVRTTDGGHTWTRIGDNINGVYRIRFTDLQNGWAMTYDGMYRTTDGGETWQGFSPYADTRLTDFDFVDTVHGWVSGWHGSLLYFDGTIISAEEQPGTMPNSFQFLPAYPNPFNPSTTLSFNLPLQGARGSRSLT